MTSRKEKRRRVAWEVKFKEHKDVTMTALGAYKSKVTVTIVTDKDELYVRRAIRSDLTIQMNYKLG